nr:MAG TPA: hypothetical protein [Caudoviricetes sp.]
MMSWPLLFSIGLKAYFNQLTTADQSPAVFFCYKLFITYFFLTTVRA